MVLLWKDQKEAELRGVSFSPHYDDKFGHTEKCVFAIAERALEFAICGYKKNLLAVPIYPRDTHNGSGEMS